jgi:hypothetical protein
MGYVRTLIPFLEQVRIMPQTCDRGSDQVALGWALHEKGSGFQMAYDHSASIFFVATENTNLSLAHVRSARPGIVHVVHSNPPPLSGHDSVWKDATSRSGSLLARQQTTMRLAYERFGGRVASVDRSAVVHM